MAKKRKFHMHPKLLYDVIRRQAGTLAKAILEGAMNTVDAKATICEIALEADTLIITDDGSGFKDMSAIEKYFETFGQPHEEHEQKVYANFRMGRGQLFAFGENVWESNKFRMDVDFKGEGDGYELTDDADKTEGCTVTVFLYKKLSPSELADVVREVKLYCKWFQIPVYLNDELISQDPAETKWDYESNKCYVKLKTTGGLAVYNLGAYTREFPGYMYGRGGVVVSKEQLKLNFARNDVMVSECPIWKEVAKFVREQAGNEIKRKPSLNEDERNHLASRIMSNTLPTEETMTQKVITDVCGRHWSIRQLGNQSFDYPCYSNAPRGSRRGDKIHQMKLSFVIADVTIDRFDCDDAKELMNVCEDVYREACKGNRRSCPLERWMYKDFLDVSGVLSSTYRLLQQDELKGDEELWQTLATEHGHVFTFQVSENGPNIQKRRIVIGEADHADGWTDGGTFIAISRLYLRGLKYACLTDLVKFGNLLLHEYCHNEIDTETHVHSPEFYQLFHDSVDATAYFAERCLRDLPRILDMIEKKAGKARLKELDRIHRLDEKAAKIAKKIAARSK